MLTNAERRAQIQAALSEATEAISATTFAKRFGVSRQTVVGDIALMRAHGDQVIATPQGYQYQRTASGEQQAVIVCRHTPAQTEDEMSLIVATGAALLDVAVDHPVYGELRGQLQIRTQTDITLFMAHLRQHPAKLLSELTGGVHLHTIAYSTPAQLTAVKTALRNAGYLYEEG